MDVEETCDSPGSCPTDEDIAAFVDATSSAAEVTRIIAHLARCERCYEVAIGTALFLLGPGGSFERPHHAQAAVKDQGNEEILSRVRLYRRQPNGSRARMG